MGTNDYGMQKMKQMRRIRMPSSHEREYIGNHMLHAEQVMRKKILIGQHELLGEKIHPRMGNTR